MKKFQTFLALATMAVLAVACSDKTTTTPATTDSTSGDTGLSGDATATTDTGKADTGTTDTGTTDTGTTDVGPAADVSGTTSAFKGCTSASDQAFLATLKDDATNKQFHSDVGTCTLQKGCLAKGTTADRAPKIQCIADCVEAIYKDKGLTADCSKCAGGLAGDCGAKNCIGQCAVNQSSPECNDCIATKCSPHIDQCNKALCDPTAEGFCGE